MFVISVADLVISINLNGITKTYDDFNDFTYSKNDETDLVIDFLQQSNIINHEKDISILEEQMEWYIDKDKQDISIILNDEYKNSMYELRVNKYWNRATIHYLSSDKDPYDTLIGLIGQTLFRNLILLYQGLVIHAAAIDWEGKGIIFTAPSDTGKSTQAHLWKYYMGAQVLNGDRPAFRIIGNKPYVYGTPWSGSTRDFMNKRAPLSAIVILEQSKENTIKELDVNDAIKHLMPRCFLPYYDSEMMKLAIDNLEKIIKKTPIYHLQCRPDREAVELVHKCVM